MFKKKMNKNVIQVKRKFIKIFYNSKINFNHNNVIYNFKYKILLKLLYNYIIKL